jgi:integrase
MSDLRTSLESYLATRRALGFSLEKNERYVGQFISWLEAAGTDKISLEACLAWASEPEGADPSWWGARLAAVRLFARWHAVFDDETEVPPDDIWPFRTRRAEPYPYTEDDICSLMGAAGQLRSPLRAATYVTLIGLLAVSGMRVGEAIALDRDDVGWDERVIVIWRSKFERSREIVLHETTMAALADYAALRDKHCPAPQSPSFFVSCNRTRLNYKNVHFVFHDLAGKVGLAPLGENCRPRIHDLRHRFALETLIGWYRADLDVEPLLPALSGYLGHLAPSDTYWYLRAAPELMALAQERVEKSHKP